MKRCVTFIVIAVICITARSAIAQRVLRGQPVPQTTPQIQTSGCPTQTETAVSPGIGPDDCVELQRSSCFGSCPVYTVRVRADGRITWRGERNVRVTGEQAGSIIPAAARALIEKFSAMDGWHLCSSYSIPVTDASTVTTTFHVGGLEKRVSDYFNSAPGWLSALEYEIDSVADTHRWIHGDPKTESLATVRTPGVVVKIGDFITPGLDADARGPKPGLTPLMQAAAKGDINALRTQLSAKVDVNAQDNDGHTPLMFAMYGSLGWNDQDRQFLERADSISLMRKEGARIDLRDSAGLTVFDYLDEEARRYVVKNSQAEELRQILQNQISGGLPVKVSERIIGLPNAGVRISSVELQRNGLGISPLRTAVTAEGGFEFGAVVPGPYTLALEPAPSFPLRTISVFVPDRNVTDLAIAVPAMREVTVRLTTEQDVPIPNSALIFVCLSGPAADSSPPRELPQDLVSVIPQNIQIALKNGAMPLQLIRLGTSPVLDNATFRIAVPSPWGESLTVTNRLTDTTYRITLPEGSYAVAAVLPRLSAALPAYEVKSLKSGSVNLVKEPLRIAAGDQTDIQVTFGTIAPISWFTLSGRVLGITAGAEADYRVVLAGDMLAMQEAPIRSDGSFEFPKVVKGRYFARVTRAAVTTATELSRVPPESIINVTDRDVAGIPIIVPR